MEPEALLKQIIDAGLLDEQKARAALSVFAQVQKMGARFSFEEFLVERGLVTQMALTAVQERGESIVRAVDTVGEFQLLELIGEGEHGAVFSALQKSLNRPVAVKILNTELAAQPEAVKGFLNEAHMTARLSHPNVVQSISAGSEQGLHYFAMELVDGASARVLLAECGGRVPEEMALDLIRQAAEGLTAAHAAGILHRDIKPDNLLITRARAVKLSDLGIARAVMARESTDKNVFFGSPPYVPPEIIRGTVENDPRSDIYSLGATFFELLTGAPPFAGEDAGETLQLHLYASVPDPRSRVPKLSLETSGLLRAMLAKEPADRPPSARAVADAAKRILQELKTQSAIQQAPRKPPPQIIRRPVPVKPGLKKGPVVIRKPFQNRFKRRDNRRPPGR